MFFTKYLISYYNFSLLPAKVTHLALDRLGRLVHTRPTAQTASKTPQEPAKGISKYFLYSETPSKPVNEVVKYILYLEANLIRLGISFPIGVHIALLARKRF